MGASYQATPEDFDALVAEARAAGTDPLGALLLLYVESAGFDPAQKDPAGTGGGLNQMDADNLAAAGIPLAQWVAMTAAAQLPHIFAFWKSLAGSSPFPPDGAHLLALNFLPGYYPTTAAVSPTKPIVSRGDAKGYYAANASTYDPAGTGSITVDTIAAGQQAQLARGNAAQQARWSSLVAGLNAAIARAQPTPIPPAAVAAAAAPTVAQAGFGVAALVGGALWLLWHWLGRR